jgi:hypothetical protein
MATVSGHLALKTWMPVSAGDVHLAQDAQAGLAVAAARAPGGRGSISCGAGGGGGSGRYVQLSCGGARDRDAISDTSCCAPALAPVFNRGSARVEALLAEHPARAD